MISSTHARRLLPMWCSALALMGCAPVNVTLQDVTGIDARGAKTGDIAVNASANVNAQANVNTNSGAPAAPAAPSAPATPAPTPRAYEGRVTTLVGNGTARSADGDGAAATVDPKGAIALDRDGNLYFVDARKGTVRKVTPAGHATTLAELGAPGARGIAVDSKGAVYVTDEASRAVLKIGADGKASVYVGGSTATGTVGKGADANLGNPISLCFNAQDTLYVGAATQLFRVDVVENEVIATRFTGIQQDWWDEPGYNDVWGTARFNTPIGLTTDAAGLLYVADRDNGFIRRVDEAHQAITTLAGWTRAIAPGFAEGKGDKAKFDRPSAIAVDAAGYLYVADTNNHRIRRVAPDGTTSTIAGGKQGFADGVGADAMFNAPVGLAIAPDGALYVADSGNARIRVVR